MQVDMKSYVGQLLENIAKEQEKKEKSGYFTIISASEDPASQIYMKHKKTDAEKCHIPYETFHSESKEELEKTITRLNGDANCIGIMLQLPLCPALQGHAEALIDLIDPAKDIDGLTTFNQSRIALGLVPHFYPCTALGVVDLLDFLETNYTKSPIAVIGRSKLVGRPLLSMLQARNATTIACHSKTKNLAEITKTCGVVVSATGIPGLITENHLSSGALLVDVGISRLESGSIVGDGLPSLVDSTSVTVTPVPGGMGLLTRASLMKNIVKQSLLK